MPARIEVSEAPLSPAEYEEAAVVSARAFQTDPFFAFLSTHAIRRARGLSLWSHGVCRNLGPKGRLLTARDGTSIVGVAAWIPPGGYPYPIGDQVRLQLSALRALYREPPALTKGLKYIAAIDKAHPKEPLWYLQLLVTDPERQRQGVGTALMEGVLDECDREGLPAYLETQKEANLAYYARFAFEVEKTLHPVAAGPPLWTLRRQPRTT